MTIQNVYGKETARAAAPAAETFENYPVKDGKLQGSFYQFGSTIQKAQERYDAAQVAKKGWTLMTPVNFVVNSVKSFLSYIGKILSNVLSICSYSKDVKADDKKVEKKA